jgi:hypothetical protein
VIGSTGIRTRRQEAEARIQAELNGIAAEGRELTMWEADCFRVALIALALHDHSAALAAVRAADSIPACSSARRTDITVHDFLRGLALVSQKALPTVQ